MVEEALGAGQHRIIVNNNRSLRCGPTHLLRVDSGGTGDDAVGDNDDDGLCNTGTGSDTDDDNDGRPDVDDTAAVGWAMCLADRERYADSITRAARWVAGMQSRNGPGDTIAPTTGRIRELRFE